MNIQDPRVHELARLQIEMGAALQNGQRIHIKGVPVSCAPYAEVLVQEAYLAGAANVEVFWESSSIERLRLLHAQEDALDDWYGPNESAWEEMVQRGDCELAFFGTDPCGIDGCNAKRIERADKVRRKMTAPLVQAHCANRIRISTSALPTTAWAREVFPAYPENEAIDLLWDAVFAACRITGDGKAAARWHDFVRTASHRCNWLNGLELSSIHYYNKLGTDVCIGLPEGYLWSCARDQSEDGVQFFANFPSEEVYTSPHRDRAEGTIVSSMPLYWKGTVIEGIHLTMKEGKVVAASASRGNALLQEMLARDEGARHLGECALVSWNSPIRQSGISFHNMLFDENAACHFALGQGFPSAVSSKSWEKSGINHSQLHMDLMIGTEDLCVIGMTRSGRKIPIFKDGCWAGGDLT